MNEKEKRCQVRQVSDPNKSREEQEQQYRIDNVQQIVEKVKANGRIRREGPVYCECEILKCPVCPIVCNYCVNDAAWILQPGIVGNLHEIVIDKWDVQIVPIQQCAAYHEYSDE